MSTTSDDMKKGLTFRKFKDGETSQYRKGSEWIFDADHTQSGYLGQPTYQPGVR